MTLTQSPYKAIFWVNHPPNGYTETWHLRAGNMNDARADTYTLAEARSFLLAADTVLEFAAVQTENAPYIQWAAIGNPLLPLPQWGYVDNDWTSLLWRFDTGQGKGVPRHFRAVADDEVSAGRWARAPFAIPPGPAVYPLVPSLATIPDLYRYVMATFRDLTCYAHELPPDGLGQVFWEQTPWAHVIFRGVSSYNVGAQYYRGSWEPRDYVEQPGFSPCGTVVCALRTFYEQEASYFSSGPVQGIRYYKAAPGATVMQFQSLFWGQYLAKQIPDGESPGERKSKITYGYSKGLSWGSAPGLVPGGIELQFLGRTVCPWGLSQTTPVPYYEVCDVPTPLPILVDNDPAGDSNADVQWITFAAPIVANDLGGNHVQVELDVTDLVLTVASSSPVVTCPETTLLTFLGIHGFSIVQAAANQVSVLFADAGAAQKGAVNIDALATQQMGAGPKSFDARVYLLSAGYPDVYAENVRSGGFVGPQGYQLGDAEGTMTLGRYGSPGSGLDRVIFSEKVDTTVNFERGFNLGAPGDVSKLRWGQNGIWTNITAIEVVAGHVTWIDGDYAPIDPAPIAGPSPTPPFPLPPLPPPSSHGAAMFFFATTGAVVQDASGAGMATITFAAAADSQADAISNGVATVTFEATGDGTADNAGYGTASLDFSVVGIGLVDGTGTATGAIEFAATADSQAEAISNGTGTVTFAAVAIGTADNAGAGAASLDFSVVGMGLADGVGSGAATITFAAAAISQAEAASSGAGTITFEATGAGAATLTGSGAATITFAAAGEGDYDAGPPTPGTLCSNAPEMALDTNYSYDTTGTQHYFKLATVANGGHPVNYRIIKTFWAGGNYAHASGTSDCPMTTSIFTDPDASLAQTITWTGTTGFAYIVIGGGGHGEDSHYTIRFENGSF